MHQLKILLSKLKLKNSKGKELNATNKKLFNEFIDDFCSAKNKTILYRGTESIPEYNTSIFDIEKFANIIFNIGLKSIYYTNDGSNKKLFCLNDCSEELFNSIFDKLNDKLCNRKFAALGTIEKVSSFLNSNEDFYSYFKTEENREDFLSKTDNLDEEKKIKIKDYYLSLIHIIGRSMSGNNSYMISTSTKIKVAEKFKKDGIMIVSWIPITERRNLIIKYNEVNKLNKEIEKMELPYYVTPPYIEQKEICVKCGLLPQYIIGYSLDDSFIVNKHLLTNLDMARDLNSIINDGIKINQERINEILKETKYKRGFICIDGYYLDWYKV